MSRRKALASSVGPSCGMFVDLSSETVRVYCLKPKGHAGLHRAARVSWKGFGEDAACYVPERELVEEIQEGSGR